MASFIGRFRGGVLVVLCVVLTSTMAPGQDKVDPAATRSFNKALGRQNQKLYPEAAASWKDFIKSHGKDPRVPNAYLQLGICQYRDKKYTEAAATYTALAKTYPKFESLDAALLNRGLAYYNLAQASKKPDDLRKAATAFADVPAQFPKSRHAATAMYYQAESLYQAADIKGAIPVYQKLITAYGASPLLPQVYYALGTAQQEVKQFADAAKTYQEFVKKYPKSEQANECKLRWGICLAEEGQHEEAAPIFGQVAQVDGFPLADYALMQQGNSTLKQKKKDLAKAAGIYESVSKRFPKSQYLDSARLAAGKCWFEIGKLDQARRSLELVAKKSPEAASLLGQTLIQQKDYKGAITVLDAAIGGFAQSKELPELTFIRINALYEQPDQRKATVTLYKAFAARYPDHLLAPQAIYMSALTSLKLGDFETARQMAESFVGNNKFAKHELLADALFVAAEGNLNAEKSDPAKAEKFYRRLITESPEHANVPQAKLRVGLCLLQAKKYDDAVSFLTQAVAGLKENALKAEAYLLIGRSHFDNGKPEPASQALQQSLGTDGNWARGDEVLLELALSLRQLKKLPDAVNYLQRLNSKYSKSDLRDEAYFQLGSIAYAQKNYKDAANHFAQLVSQFPKSELAGEAQFWNGLSYLTNGDNKAAIQAFTKQIDSYPKSTITPQSRYRRGIAYHGLKEYDPAEKDLSAFLTTKDADPMERLHAQHVLALCQSGLKQYDKAAATLAQLLKEKPDYAQADQVYYDMAFALRDAGKEKDATIAFQQLAAKFPDSPRTPHAWFFIGESYENGKDLPQATKAFSEGLAKTKAKDELREKLQYKLGWCHYSMKKYDAAAKVLEGQVKEFPKGDLWADGTSLAGESLFHLEQFRDALPMFESLIKNNDKEHLDRALYRAGNCLGHLQKYSESERYYARLIREFPKFKLVYDARYGLARALQGQDKFDQAKAMFDEITKAKDPEIANSELAAKSRYMIGACAFAEKNYKEAILHFLETHDSYGYKKWKAEGFCEAARCYVLLKDKKNAIDLFSKVVKMYPDEPIAKEAAKHLANLMK